MTFFILQVTQFLSDFFLLEWNLLDNSIEYYWLDGAVENVPVALVIHTLKYRGYILRMVQHNFHILHKTSSQILEGQEDGRRNVESAKAAHILNPSLLMSDSLMNVDDFIM